MEILSTKNLCYSYYKSPMLIKDISLSCSAGCLFVLGQKSSGKTTFAKLITGLIDSYAGKIEVLKTCPRQISEQISYITYPPVFVRGKVKDNITFALKQITGSAKVTPWLRENQNKKINKLSDVEKFILASERAKLKNGALVVVDVCLDNISNQDLPQYVAELQSLLQKNRLLVVCISAKDYKKLQFCPQESQFLYLFASNYVFYENMQALKNNIKYSGLADYLPYNKTSGKVVSNSNGYFLTAGNQTEKIAEKHLGPVLDYFAGGYNSCDVDVFYLGELDISNLEQKMVDGDILLFDKICTERLIG